MLKSKKIIHLFIIALLTTNKMAAQNADTVTVVIDTTAKYPYQLEPPSWRYAATSASNDKWYVYKKYLSKSYNSITIWIQVKMDTTTYRKKLYKNAYEKKLIEVDCKNSKVKFLTTTLYNSRGNVIDTYEDSYPEFEYVIPDTVMETVLEKICKLYD